MQHWLLNWIQDAHLRLIWSDNVIDASTSGLYDGRWVEIWLSNAPPPPVSHSSSKGGKRGGDHWEDRWISDCMIAPPAPALSASHHSVDWMDQSTLCASSPILPASLYRGVQHLRWITRHREHLCIFPGIYLHIVSLLAYNLIRTVSVLWRYGLQILGIRTSLE